MSFDRDASMSPDYFRPSMQYLGRSNPKYVGGFNTYFRYKNIEFSTQWSYKIGHIIPSFNDLQNAPNNWEMQVKLPSDMLVICVSGTNRERRYLTLENTRRCNRCLPFCNLWK
ncbi:MAG: hypothetical protein ACLU4J_02065 [Butyricimonas paravirosa]